MTRAEHDASGEHGGAVTCIGCGHDLRRLAVGAACPVCGAERGGGSGLAGADPGRVRRIAAGIRALSVSCWLGAATLPLVLPLLEHVVTVYMALPQQPEIIAMLVQPKIIGVQLVIGGGGLLALVLLAAGTLRVTAREPFAARGAVFSAFVVSRVLLVVLLAVVAAGSALVVSRRGPPADVVIWDAFAALLFVGAGVLMSALSSVGLLVARVPARTLAKRVRRGGWVLCATLAVSGLMIAVPFEMLPESLWPAIDIAAGYGAFVLSPVMLAWAAVRLSDCRRELCSTLGSEGADGSDGGSGTAQPKTMGPGWGASVGLGLGQLLIASVLGVLVLWLFVANAVYYFVELRSQLNIAIEIGYAVACAAFIVALSLGVVRVTAREPRGSGRGMSGWAVTARVSLAMVGWLLAAEIIVRVAGLFYFNHILHMLLSVRFLAFAALCMGVLTCIARLMERVPEGGRARRIRGKRAWLVPLFVVAWIATPLESILFLWHEDQAHTAAVVAVMALYTLLVLAISGVLVWLAVCLARCRRDVLSLTAGRDA